MAGPDGDAAAVPSQAPSECDSDLTDLSVVSVDNGDCRDERRGLLLNCDHIVMSIITSCSRGTLAALMGVNRKLYRLVAPMLYDVVRLDEAAIPSFFYGCTTMPETRGELDDGRGRGRRRSGSSNDRRKSKAELLASTRVLTLEPHSGRLCSINAPGAACMTGLETLRISMHMGDGGSSGLCSHSQCEFLQVLEPLKLVIRNCNGRTRLPLDLRWSLPRSVETVVLFLPTAAREYYDLDGDALPQLTRNIVGKFRLASVIKIVFWDEYEGPSPPPRGDFLISYRQERILVDDLFALLQSAVCTNHRPWPLVTVYGLETLDLKADASSALVRMHAGLTDPHELLQHSLHMSHHILVPSPWTGQKVPYRIPTIIWDDIEVYELDDDRGAEIVDDE